ncbi:MAG: methyltransferase family protein [Gammaproteobacteria bacterium]
MDELSMGSELAYGHWHTVAINAVAWVGACYWLLRPRLTREYLAFLFFALFLIAEFVELFGYPFTLILVTQQLRWVQATDALSFSAGDLWRLLFEIDARFESLDLFHLTGGVLIFGGLIVLYLGFAALRAAAQSRVPATTGPYRWVRHPQYLSVFSIMLGHLVQGPTLPIFVLFPVIVFFYRWLALREEHECGTHFGQAYGLYRQRTPRFLR